MSDFPSAALEEFRPITPSNISNNCADYIVFKLTNAPEFGDSHVVFDVGAFNLNPIGRTVWACGKNFNGTTGFGHAQGYISSGRLQVHNPDLGRFTSYDAVGIVEGAWLRWLRYVFCFFVFCFAFLLLGYFYEKLLDLSYGYLSLIGTHVAHKCHSQFTTSILPRMAGQQTFTHTKRWSCAYLPFAGRPRNDSHMLYPTSPSLGRCTYIFKITQTSQNNELQRKIF